MSSSWISTPRVKELLDSLYADAAANDPLARQAAMDEIESARLRGETLPDFYRSMRHAYMAVGPQFGALLYTLATSSRATTIVEFGTSFGVSTIFLASAVRDLGKGKVITTEFSPEKVERARQNLASAGLEEWVEFRTGDALETLSPPPEEIDMVLLDGPKALYFGVLKLLEPALHPGAIIASDNTDHDGMRDFLAYIREPGNGYTSSAILTGYSDDHHGCHEITIRAVVPA